MLHVALNAELRLHSAILSVEKEPRSRDVIVLTFCMLYFPATFQDLHKCPMKESCCDKAETIVSHYFPCNGQASAAIWRKATTLKSLYSMLASYPADSVRLVVGDTGKGDDCTNY